MIEQAKALDPAMRFFTGGCDNLLLEAECIDIMTVCAAYHHFPEVDKFAKEAGRVIMKEGLLYIAEVYLPGKIYNFTDAEVKWYTITNGPKHYFITLCTKSKRMWINSYSPNYRQVKKLVQQKYKEWERYAGGN